MAWNFLKNPGRTLFGSAPRSGYRDQQAEFARNLGNLSGAYQNRLARSQEGVQRFDPMYQAAVRTRLGYLQEQPFASEQDALTLGRAAGDISRQYGEAQSNVARMLAQRGLGGGLEAGTLANLEGARMGQRAAAQYNTALARIAARNAAQQEAVQLAGGARGMYSGEEMGNLAGLQGLYGQGFEMYGGMAGAEEAARAAHQQRILGMIQQAATMAGTGGVTTPQYLGYTYTNPSGNQVSIPGSQLQQTRRRNWLRL
jgi:hypothetical protein